MERKNERLVREVRENVDEEREIQQRDKSRGKYRTQTENEYWVKEK